MVMVQVGLSLLVGLSSAPGLHLGDLLLSEDVIAAAVPSCTCCCCLFASCAAAGVPCVVPPDPIRQLLTICFRLAPVADAADLDLIAKPRFKTVPFFNNNPSFFSPGSQFSDLGTSTI